MGVVNNGTGPTFWSIQASTSSPDTSFLYLRGERDTAYGINKILFFCNPSGENMMLHVIFDPQGRAEEAVSMQALSLTLDETQLQVTNYLRGDVEEVNGWINATFGLSADHWAMIKHSATIGVMFQFTYEAPVFLGFGGMPLEGAEGFMSGIEFACPAAYSTASLTTPPRPFSSVFQIFRNQDFVGDDLTSEGTKDVTLNECESICTSSQQCIAYSYVERLNWCFPKSGLGNSVIKAGVTSGVKK